MNKTSKSKAVTARSVTLEQCIEVLSRPKDGKFFSLQERQKVAAKLTQTDSPLQLEDRKFDEKSEHKNDLRCESLMADESEYGPVCNERDEVGARQ